jgi:glycosyltransferase involved in cell wall biosynthesis
MKPEISVLMSCYNGSRWLNEAIDSVLEQTYKNFELILVDDGSTDETWKIIQKYRDKHEFIIAVSKENTGLPDSLNVGIAYARGKWIARIDQDDLCGETRLEEQITFVKKHPDVVFLGTGFIEINENSQIIKKHLYPAKHDKLVQHLEHLKRFFPHSSAFYRVDTVRKVGGYNTRFKNAEDWRLWLELSLQGNIACLPQYLVKIRKHTNQMSFDNKGIAQLCYSRAATVCHLLRKAGCKDPSVDSDMDEWNTFLEWIETRIKELGIFEKRKTWHEARKAFFDTENRLLAFIHFCMQLLFSGHCISLIWEKLFGSSLPQRLMQEWLMLTK